MLHYYLLTILLSSILVSPASIQLSERNIVKGVKRNDISSANNSTADNSDFTLDDSAARSGGHGRNLISVQPSGVKSFVFNIDGDTFNISVNRCGQLDDTIVGIWTFLNDSTSQTATWSQIRQDTHENNAAYGGVHQAYTQGILKNSLIVLAMIENYFRDYVCDYGTTIIHDELRKLLQVGEHYFTFLIGASFTAGILAGSIADILGNDSMQVNRTAVQNSAQYLVPSFTLLIAGIMSYFERGGPAANLPRLIAAGAVALIHAMADRVVRAGRPIITSPILVGGMLSAVSANVTPAAAETIANAVSAAAEDEIPSSGLVASAAQIVAGKDAASHTLGNPETPCISQAMLEAAFQYAQYVSSAVLLANDFENMTATSLEQTQGTCFG